MATPSNEAQKARAERLRARVEELSAKTPPSETAPPTPLSPREFIHQQMAALDAEPKKRGSKAQGKGGATTKKAKKSKKKKGS